MELISLRNNVKMSKRNKDQKIKWKLKSYLKKFLQKEKYKQL